MRHTHDGIWFSVCGCHCLELQTLLEHAVSLWFVVFSGFVGFALRLVHAFQLSLSISVKLGEGECRRIRISKWDVSSGRALFNKDPFEEFTSWLDSAESVSSNDWLFQYWVDLCHQPDDDDDYEGSFTEEALLRKSFNESPLANQEGHRKWFPLRLGHVGNRQKIVILVVLLIFVIMMAVAVIIWIGLGKNPIDSAVAVRVYVDLFAVGMLILGVAFACYGILLCLKMSKVRAEQPSYEMYKVACLTIISVLCFTSSACVALLTDIPMLYHWHRWHVHGICTVLLLILYYFVGSSIPSVMVLWVMRELPSEESSSILEESSTLAFVGDTPAAVHNPQRWTTTTSMQNQSLEGHVGIASEDVNLNPR
ncbi:tobamovirus multiplication protein 1-like isoform X2 [Senna tora]|uniref:Tobamovirus multiplication protein 1-like isoform X2 n=1 Tax=Senna tora TaxID=362788 RepID=A0A834X9T9_9FABA|nr:tobamovirus multiplication protein 1-like isoform X2 [Senna tora]